MGTAPPTAIASSDANAVVQPKATDAAEAVKLDGPSLLKHIDKDTTQAQSSEAPPTAIASSDANAVVQPKATDAAEAVKLDGPSLLKRIDEDTTQAQASEASPTAIPSSDAIAVVRPMAPNAVKLDGPRPFKRQSNIDHVTSQVQSVVPIVGMAIVVVMALLSAFGYFEDTVVFGPATTSVGKQLARPAFQIELDKLLARLSSAGYFVQHNLEASDLKSSACVGDQCTGTVCTMSYGTSWPYGLCYDASGHRVAVITTELVADVFATAAIKSSHPTSPGTSTIVVLHTSETTSTDISSTTPFNMSSSVCQYGIADSCVGVDSQVVDVCNQRGHDMEVAYSALFPGGFRVLRCNTRQRIAMFAQTESLGYEYGLIRGSNTKVRSTSNIGMVFHADTRTVDWTLTRIQATTLTATLWRLAPLGLLQVMLMLGTLYLGNGATKIGNCTAMLARLSSTTVAVTELAIDTFFARSYYNYVVRTNVAHLAPVHVTRAIVYAMSYPLMGVFSALAVHENVTTLSLTEIQVRGFLAGLVIGVLAIIEPFALGPYKLQSGDTCAYPGVATCSADTPSWVGRVATSIASYIVIGMFAAASLFAFRKRTTKVPPASASTNTFIQHCCDSVSAKSVLQFALHKRKLLDVVSLDAINACGFVLSGSFLIRSKDVYVVALSRVCAQWPRRLKEAVPLTVIVWPVKSKTDGNVLNVSGSKRVHFADLKYMPRSTDVVFA